LIVQDLPAKKEPTPIDTATREHAEH
jgi:hypothetical protein